MLKSSHFHFYLIFIYKHIKFMYIVGDKEIKKQEDKGRDIFLICHPNMVWTENKEKFGVWDLRGESGKSRMYIEIKNRDIKSTSYTTTFLEKKKLDNLNELKVNGEKTKIYYFVTYSDNVSYLFDLTKLKPKQYTTSKIWMKEVTLDNQHKQVQKEVIELPLTVAKKKYTITYTSC